MTTEFKTTQFLRSKFRTDRAWEAALNEARRGAIFMVEVAHAVRFDFHDGSIEMVWDL